jgi:hypothetical protein
MLHRRLKNTGHNASGAEAGYDEKIPVIRYLKERQK